MRKEFEKKLNAMLDTDDRQSGTDPLGSWTGVPADPEDLPVQDADDL